MEPINEKMQYVQQLIEITEKTPLKQTFDFGLEIDSICDLKVNVNFTCEFNPGTRYLKYAALHIESRDIWVTIDGDYDALHLHNVRIITIESNNLVDQFTDCLNQIAAILQVINFDVMEGRFVSQTTAKKTFCEAFNISNERVVCSGQECCVCYTKTKTKPECGHALCIPCWSKIKDTPDDPDDDEFRSKKCPMCRVTLNI